MICASVSEQLPCGTVLDGEIVCWRRGRLDFPALQRRLAAGGRSRSDGGAAGLVVFDVLAFDGQDLRGQRYAARRRVLVELLAEARAPLALVPMTPDRETARAWLTEHSAEGIEGVVAKHADHTYTARRAWQKIRTQLSGEAVVGGVLGPVDAPRALVLGRPDGRGHLRVVGQTLPLPRAASDELGAVLHPADAAHPWPATLRPRFGDATPLRYTRVRPDVVVELDVDTAQDDGRWRHPTRYRRQRVDLRTPDLEPRPSRDR